MPKWFFFFDTGSSNPPQRRKRRTRAELAAALADPNDPYKGPKKRGKRVDQGSSGTTVNSAINSGDNTTRDNTTQKTQASTPSPPDSSRPFARVDYELICTYLEEEEKIKNLFGSGSKTTVGPGCMTHAQEFEKLMQYMNDVRVDLNLSARQMRQQFDT